MAISKEDAHFKYNLEIFRQTRPYSFEVAFMQPQIESLLPGDDAKIPTGKIIYFPDEEKNVLSFEGITEDYLIFVNRYGVTEKSFDKVMLSLGSDADVIYCDEDFTIDVNVDLSDTNERMKSLRTPFRKPDYSPDTMVSFPYIETCFAVKTVFARQVPTLPESLEISDTVRCCDFLMRSLERTTKITHVPHILYHRDIKALVGDTDPSLITDSNIYNALYERYRSAGYRLLTEAAFMRRGMDEMPPFPEKKPVVSIIIPSKDNPEVLKECIRKIRNNAGRVPYEIIVVDNGSSENNKAFVDKYVSELPGGRGLYIYEEMEFNFSRMCNMGADAAKGDFLLFLNDDVDVCVDGFLEKMLVYARRNHIGAVGVKLLYPDGCTIQHAGVFDTARGPVHKLNTLNDNEIHYYCRNRFVWNVLAVTGACLMVGREKYFNVCGFNDKMKVGYNDVDLCVKLVETGLYNVVINDFYMIHHESLSRGGDAADNDKADRLRQERNLFYEFHPWLAQHNDPFYGTMLDEDTIEIKSAAVADYQVSDFRNTYRRVNRIWALSPDKAGMSVDSCSIERGIGESAEDAYVIEGWGLLQRGDNALYKKSLILIPVDENNKPLKDKLIFSVCDKLRTDVAGTFPDAENVLLAGFTCRIPFSAVNENGRYKVGVLFNKIGGPGLSKYTIGDYIYEPRRGIITDK